MGVSPHQGQYLRLPAFFLASANLYGLAGTRIPVLPTQSVYEVVVA